MALWLALSGSNYSCRERISTVPKMFVPLNFDSTLAIRKASLRQWRCNIHKDFLDTFFFFFYMHYFLVSLNKIFNINNNNPPLCVALWFILRGDLFYVLPCVIFILVFFSPFCTAITLFGEKRAILVLFVRLFDLPLFGFVCLADDYHCIYMWYKVLQSLNEINASLHKLLSGNEKSDDDTDDDADGQHGPYVSAMLRRRHKKGKEQKKSKGS